MIKQKQVFNWSDCLKICFKHQKQYWFRSVICVLTTTVITPYIQIMFVAHVVIVIIFLIKIIIVNHGASYI